MDELDLPPRTDGEDHHTDRTVDNTPGFDLSGLYDDPCYDIALDIYCNACRRAEQQCSNLPAYGLTSACIDYILRAYPVFYASESSYYKADWLENLFGLFATKKEKAELSNDVWDALWDLSLEPPELDFWDSWAEDVMRMLYSQGLDAEDVDKWGCYIALKQYGVQHRQLDSEATRPTNGLKIAITGTIPGLTRKQITDAIRAAGGEVLSSVSSKCDCLVVGKNPGSKLVTAKKLGIRCITIQDLLTMLGGSFNQNDVPEESEPVAGVVPDEPKEPETPTEPVALIQDPDNGESSVLGWLRSLLRRR